jgi:hypothetical protein
MPDFVLRLGIFVVVVLLLCLFTWTGRGFVERRRKLALMAAPINSGANLDRSASGDNIERTGASPSRVRILAFGSDDCRQCHTLQAPALKRLLDARGDEVALVDVDAPNAPELTRRYQVLTVPTTVVLDAAGHACAVNYGFASTQRLLEQVDAILAQ